MLDQWFKRDIQNRTERHSLAVFLDEYGATEAPPLDSRFRGNDKQIRDGLIISWGFNSPPLVAEVFDYHSNTPAACDGVVYS